jgi:rod shape-determining protein MreC
MMFFPLKKHRFFFLAVFLLVLSLSLVSWDITTPRATSLIKKTLLDALSLPLRAFSLSFQKLDFFIDKYLLLVNLKEENRFLQEEIHRLRNENRLLAIEAKENKRLRSLLLLKERSPVKTVAAEILGEDPSGWYKMLLVDKGSRQGVKPGNGVISPDGAVGRVLDVGENIAKVLLVVDNNSAIDAMIARTHGRGIVEGKGGGVCELKYVALDEDVRPGDQVICSGLGGVFPEGCPIGTVTRVSRGDGGLFQYVELAPLVNFSRIEEILVITNHPQNK